MRNSKLSIIMVALTVVLLSSCASYTSEYFVNGQSYALQDSSQFRQPADPENLAENEVFVGWELQGTDGIYTNWQMTPEYNARFDAVIDRYIDFYVGDEVWASVKASEFANPGVPTAPADNLQFVGWVPEGAENPVENWTTPPRDVNVYHAKFVNTVKFYNNGVLVDTQLVTDFADPGVPVAPSTDVVFAGWCPVGTEEAITDWSVAPEGVDEVYARYVDKVYFYLDGNLWTVLRADQFTNPGDPVPRDIPRGYEFAGWVAETDYATYTDWTTLPDDVRRFDAMLTSTTVASGMDSANEQLRLNLAKNTQVLGPITVEETYEIVGDQVRIGGIGYKDILAAAIEAYPDADQVVDIITDYETHTADSDYGTLTFQTASYTGIAIAIE